MNDENGLAVFDVLAFHGLSKLDLRNNPEIAKDECWPTHSCRTNRLSCAVPSGATLCALGQVPSNSSPTILFSVVDDIPDISDVSGKTDIRRVDVLDNPQSGGTDFEFIVDSFGDLACTLTIQPITKDPLQELTISSTSFAVEFNGSPQHLGTFEQKIANPYVASSPALVTFIFSQTSMQLACSSGERVPESPVSIQI